jgi:anti-anti-sigma factor
VISAYSLLADLVAGVQVTECKLQGVEGRGERLLGLRIATGFPKEIFMTTAILEPKASLIFQATEPAELNELVRGQEVRLLEHVGPMVRERSVALDMAGVERIDAAGITALVALYRSAREFGHRFTLTNVSVRVGQILSVVGLDRYLMSHNVVRTSQCDSQFQRPAA